MYDVTTKIQIWNASNSENVGHTVCDPVLFEGVTCHTDHWNSVSSIHVINISSCVPAPPLAPGDKSLMRKSRIVYIHAY